MSEPRPSRRFMPNCEDVHHLTMKGMDRPLSWIERLRVRSHLAICEACTNFSGQMRTMREAMRRLGQDEGGADQP
ncbi:zf-HC2 domain-containing protein [Cupriavidus sp. RAF12]|uniref:zf-HC2 domain-containing protein n=1 Tax=Cupriavidus sp. RAF12 TaxID=3233050 RepID=UPI003F90E9C4